MRPTKSDQSSVEARIQVLLATLQFPFIVAANEVHQHVLVEQGAQFLQVGSVYAAKIGMLELLDCLDVQQALHVLAQFIDTTLSCREGQAVTDSHGGFVQGLSLFAHSGVRLACV